MIYKIDMLNVCMEITQFVWITVHLIYGPSDPVNPPAMLNRFR
jgi:hypothetical protein